MSRTALLALGSLFIVMALIITAPLIIATRLAGDGLANAVVYGSVWQGRIYGARVGEFRLDEVEISAQPMSLLGLSPVFDWQINDAQTRGHGQAFVGFGQRGLRSVRLTSSLSGFGLELPAIDPTEVVVLELDELIISDSGCVRAAGTLRTAALISLGAQYDLQAPSLSGTLSCEQGVLRLTLSGSAQDMQVNVDVFWPASGIWRWTAEIETRDARLGSVLTAAGFEREAGIWRGRGEG